ncbi:agmatinase [Sulfobacillus harzensis]|uniref:Agmatinase n=1 Tax=Sulfobacillus harzensis TaxID=2729629 RepID=A0A7Y0Q0F6_9FIRM|nr:agmatinase [Sulfobacillus harzensis]NMP20973.1 agmatinase [Sulfobacillus harzensis]
MSGFSRTDRFLGMNASGGAADVIYFGIPMDFTVSFQPGSRFGPARVREASYAIETYSLAQDRDLEDVAIHDAGDLELPFGNVSESLARIYDAADGVLEQGCRFFALGGEHLVSLPLVEAVIKRYPDLAVVHFDAHADLRDDYLGEKLSHATVLRRITELLRPKSLYQFGIRSATREEVAFAKEHGHFHPHEVLRPLSERLSELKGRPIYVTIDIDVIDPAFMPGTGTPEPGGISSGEALEAVRLLRELDVVSMDLVEAMPAHDLSQRSAVLAAKLVREGLLAMTTRV